MPVMRPFGKNRIGGFSLIELMIAMVAGLIVLGAVIAFTVSTVRAYGENIRSSRLTQDLRTSMTLIMRELRRAGFDGTSVTRVLTATSPSNFTAMTVSGECVVYRYDRGVGGAGGSAQATEVRAIRRNAAAGTLQMNASTSTVDCTAATGWVDISDPQVVDITKFTPILKTAPFCTRLSSKTDPTDPTKLVWDIAVGDVRNLSLCLKGRLRRDGAIERTVVDTSRPRAENVVFKTDVDEVTADTLCPATPTAFALSTPAQLNSDCASP